MRETKEKSAKSELPKSLSLVMVELNPAIGGIDPKMDLKKLFLKYRRKKELYVSRLEQAWEEELSSKDSLALAKTCSDILDSVVKMAKTLEELAPPPPEAQSPLDSMSDEELERHIERAKKALSKEPVGGLEATGED